MSATTLQLPARLPDGQQVTLTVEREHLVGLVGELHRVKAPVVGYAALRLELAKAGVSVAVRTLKDKVSRGRIPCRRFGGRVTFYVSEVLESIGGKS